MNLVKNATKKEICDYLKSHPEIKRIHISPGVYSYCDRNDAARAVERFSSFLFLDYQHSQHDEEMFFIFSRTTNERFINETII